MPSHNTKQDVRPLVIPQGYLTIGQVAAMLGWCSEKVSRNMNSGLLAEAKVPGVHKRRLVRRDVLERFARNRGIELT
jgi:hypothetical protein